MSAMNWIYMPPIDMEWEAEPRIKSLDNVDHVPAGGNVSIHSHPVKWKAEAKVSSIDEEHIASFEKFLSAPKKDHVRRIKIPPTIPASKYKRVEYTRNVVYAIVEPVKIEAKSRINLPKPDEEVIERQSKVNVASRIKMTKNARVDNYNNVERTDTGTYVVVDRVKIDAKSKVGFPKFDSATVDRTSKVDVSKRIKMTKNSRVDNYKNIERTGSGTYVKVDRVKIDAKSKIDFPKSDLSKISPKKSTATDVEHKYPFF